MNAAAREQGAVLLLVFATIALLSMLTLVSFEAFLLSLRADRRAVEALRQFHFADTALARCEQALRRRIGSLPPSVVTAADADRAGSARAVAAARRLMASEREPDRWRREKSFDAGRDVVAFALGVGRASVTVPCRIEPWIAAGEGVAPVWLLTVRAPSPDVGVWLQSAWIGDAYAGGRAFWRQVAEPPFR